MTHYGAITDAFRKIIKTAKRNVERVKKSHRVALIRRVAGPSESIDRLVESTLGELRGASLALNQGQIGLAAIPACEGVLDGGKMDPDLVDLFE